MLLAVVALAAAARQRLVTPLAIILMLQVPEFEYLSRASSRDGIVQVFFCRIGQVTQSDFQRTLRIKHRKIDFACLPLFIDLHENSTNQA